MFTEIFQRFHDRTLFQCDNGTSFRYAEVHELSLRPAIQNVRGQLVFCLCANVPGALLGYLGLITAGAVPVMLSATISPSHLAQLVECYRPAFAWLPQVRTRELHRVSTVMTEWDHSLVAFDTPNAESIHDSLALLLTTSGSTGSPKMVRISHENIISNAQAISDYLGLTCNEIPITTLPPSYTYGLSVIHSHLLNGCEIALTNRTLFDRQFWEFLEASKASSMSGVPYHYEMMRKLKFTSMDLPNLRTLTQAGGRLKPTLVSEYATHCVKKGIRFFVMYGQAEATARMSYLAPEKALLKPDSIGQPVPGGRMWLEDESGNIIHDVAHAGQLVYQGKNVCLGYAESARDLAKGNEFGDILKTGDVAQRDAEGDYYIVGRLSRFLKFFGHRVNLQDIEDDLQEQGYVTACTGKDDQLDVFICDAGSESAKAIKNAIAGKLKLPPNIIRILIVKALPRNESGKIQYSELSQLRVEALL